MKRTGTKMRAGCENFAGLTAVFLLLAALWGCKEDKNKAEDGGVKGDGGTDSDTGSESDTGDGETPPNLPELCTVTYAQNPLLPQDPISGDGDGRSPDVGFSGSAIVAWAYDERGTDPDWDIQVAPYRPDADAGVVDDPVEPAPSPKIGTDPRLAARQGKFGIVWLDGRWDPKCDPTNSDNCVEEVAFIQIDNTGNPLMSEPLRVSLQSMLSGRPSVAATSSGYDVAWIEGPGDGKQVVAAAVSDDGKLGQQYQISTGSEVYPDQRPQIAAVGDTVVAVWLSSDQRRLMSRVFKAGAAPQAEEKVIDEGHSCLSPSLAAGQDGFVVSWAAEYDSGYEIFTAKLDSNGNFSGQINRATWTYGDVKYAVLAAHGSDYALAWLSSKSSGEKSCAVATCNPQVFATSLDSNGEVSGKPVKLTDNPNSCNEVSIAWDGSEWTAIWELRGDMRQRIYLGRMKCEIK